MNTITSYRNELINELRSKIAVLSGCKLKRWCFDGSVLKKKKTEVHYLETLYVNFVAVVFEAFKHNVARASTVTE